MTDCSSLWALAGNRGFVTEDSSFNHVVLVRSPRTMLLTCLTRYMLTYALIAFQKIAVRRGRICPFRLTMTLPFTTSNGRLGRAIVRLGSG